MNAMTTDSESLTEELGIQRGFYAVLERIGYTRPSEVARRCRVSEEEATAWLKERKNAGWLDFEPTTGTYSLGCAWPPLANRAYGLEV